MLNNSCKYWVCQNRAGSLFLHSSYRGRSQSVIFKVLYFILITLKREFVQIPKVILADASCLSTKVGQLQPTVRETLTYLLYAFRSE